MKEITAVVRYPAIYEPMSSPLEKDKIRYGVVLLLEDNENIADKIPFEPRFIRDKMIFKHNLFSRFRPIVTCADVRDYERLNHLLQICDARNISRNRIFDGATVTLKLEQGTLMEIVINNPDQLNDVTAS